MQFRNRSPREPAIVSNASSSSRLIVLGLFLFSFGIYLLTASGRDYSTDGAQSYYTVRNVLLQGTIKLGDDGPKIGAARKNGDYYSKYGPMQAIAEAPYF